MMLRSLSFIQKTVQRSRKFSSAVVISEEVKHALETGAPLVALESTIITHGMPFPGNVKCALDVEKIVRVQGAIPTTIGILNGQVKVGLSEKEITALGDTNSSKPVKTSRRDMAYVIQKKLNGGTTVAGTLLIASGLGIKIFATGGIGGVHRGAEKSFDISRDLVELGKSNVAVVSSGVKSILDIPKTLEVLESLGVFVATFGESNDFPAFYSRRSKSKSPYIVPDAQTAAEIIKTSQDLHLNSGMLFAVPVPKKHAINFENMNKIIENALNVMDKAIQGKDVTPYLLKELGKLTEGKSLDSNIALIQNNAKVAADIAVAFSKLGISGTARDKEEVVKEKSKIPVIIGGSTLDWSANLETANVQPVPLVPAKRRKKRKKKRVKRLKFTKAERNFLFNVFKLYLKYWKSKKEAAKYAKSPKK